MSENQGQDNESNSEPESWVCTSCGNEEYYSAKEYKLKYGQKLTEKHKRTLSQADKVCANCGQVE